ncbi:hypothetical protein [Limnobaculum xujianqingii]|uniref:hypothetical protein n=1 Tax=Limnobaculum xujianqingii TaxID=2738837 RepID=UPI001127757A|nr:hypothetical protein [Limnobaculum xujianqingii]
MDDWLWRLFSSFGAAFIVIVSVAFKKTDIYYKFIRRELYKFSYCFFGASLGSLFTIMIFHSYVMNIKTLIQGREIIDDYYSAGFSFLVIMLALSVIAWAILNFIDKILINRTN